MTILDNGTRKQYMATPGQSSFIYDFKIFERSDLLVYENEQVLALNTDYTIDDESVGNNNGGTVELSSAATGGEVITLIRKVPPERQTDYSDAGFQPGELNGEFDRVWACIQQLITDQQLSPKLNDYEAVSLPITFDTPLPMAYLRWKADLSGFESVFLNDGVTPIDSQGFFSVDDIAELATRINNQDIAIDDTILVKSTGYFYAKKRGVATNNGLSIITENGGTTSSSQYYAKITGASDHAVTIEAPNFFNDSGSGGAYVLDLPYGKKPLSSVYYIYRFVANSNSSSNPTVDFSAVLGQAPGTTVKQLFWPTLIQVDIDQIQAGDELEIQILLPPFGQYAVIRNSAHKVLFDNFYSGSSNRMLQDVIDELFDLAGTVPNGSITVAKLAAPTAGNTYVVWQGSNDANDVIQSPASSVFSDVVALPPVMKAGAVRLSMESARVDSGQGCSCRFTLNGSVLQTFSPASTTYQTYTFDVTVAKGDRIAFQHAADDGVGPPKSRRPRVYSGTDAIVFFPPAFKESE